MPYMPMPQLHDHWNPHSRNLPPQPPTDGTRMQYIESSILDQAISSGQSSKNSHVFFPLKSIIVHKSLKFHEMKSLTGCFPSIFDKSPHIPRSRTADSMASAMEDSPSTDGFCGCLSPKGNVKTGMVQHSQFVNVFDLLESILHLHIVLMMVVSSYFFHIHSVCPSFESPNEDSPMTGDCATAGGAGVASH